MKIKFFAVGGTIDKIYFDQKSTYQVGDPQLNEMLQYANITFEYECESLFRKDSLNMTDKDRKYICENVKKDENSLIIITHGTDTMVKTALKLQEIKGKTIVLTGAMAPARFKNSDALFNLGFSIAAVEILPEGVYIAMNGKVFTPDNVRKNVEAGVFEKIS